MTVESPVKFNQTIVQSKWFWTRPSVNFHLDFNVCFSSSKAGIPSAWPIHHVRCRLLFLPGTLSLAYLEDQDTSDGNRNEVIVHTLVADKPVSDQKLIELKAATAQERLSKCFSVLFVKGGLNVEACYILALQKRDPRSRGIAISIWRHYNHAGNYERNQVSSIWGTPRNWKDQNLCS